jgi:hypothetical protein
MDIILSTGLTPPRSCDCLNLGLGFPTSYAVFMINNSRWEIIGRFVDIDGIFDNHCFRLYFHKPFIVCESCLD